MSLSEDSVKDALINPYIALIFDDSLFAEHEPILIKEDWVLENTKLIGKIGVAEWIEQFIITLSTGEAIEQISPILTTRISERLKGDHELLLDIDSWALANVKLVHEIGTEEWLWRLLGVLESA